MWVTLNRYRPFELIEYYPGVDGGLGYAYYVGMEGVYSDWDRNWFLVRPEGERVLQAILAENGVVLGVEKPPLAGDFGLTPVIAGAAVLVAALSFAGARVAAMSRTGIRNNVSNT